MLSFPNYLTVMSCVDAITVVKRCLSYRPEHIWFICYVSTVENMDRNVTKKYMTLGEYIIMRLEEEDLTLEDLDEDTIDFFYQQWLVDPEGEEKHNFYG